MSKSNVNPNHYKVAGRERQAEDILQGPHKQKFTQSRSSGRAASHVTRERAALVPGPPPQGAVPLRARRKATAAPGPRPATARGAKKRQVSGKRSTVKMRAASKTRP